MDKAAVAPGNQHVVLRRPGADQQQVAGFDCAAGGCEAAGPGVGKPRPGVALAQTVALGRKGRPSDCGERGGGQPDAIEPVARIAPVEAERRAYEGFGGGGERLTG